ncbi:hypothetical protein HCN44_011318 [Aphidius gifuensis]|uniref:NudC domain-containing protein 1 n=1 Tax=Aphidius gifuensis TaxID=684658 RepID=A0A835CRK4_APHGI|nr:nudC domain-containing protein 1-like [Aphidius gifuensis]KAF7994049.1 hypothetical protein HCN44_011318 [Aphidius gifuensis]
MTKIINLRPDKSLLNSNFEKYQFSSDVVVVTKEKSLTKDVYRQEPLTGQDSWLEARLFAFHNHLFENPFDSSCWFCDDDLKIWKINKDGDLLHVHTLPDNNKEKLYNPTITFASDKIIVLTSGGDSIEFLIMSNDDTGDNKSFSIDKIESGILMDSKLINEKLQIIVAMCSITDSDIKNKKHSKISLLTFTIDNNNLPEKIDIFKRQELTVNGPVEYIFVESNGEFINMLSQDKAVFKFDSLNKIKQDVDEVNDKNDVKIPKYCWSQDEDSLTVWIKIPEKYLNAKKNVKITANTITVDVEETILIQGETQYRLDAETATWNNEKDALKLELMKSVSGQMWNELIKGDNGGEHLPNAALADEIHSRLAHLCSDEPVTAESLQPTVGFNVDQLEECDLEGKDNYIQRINIINHTTTHLAMLGSHNHILFTQKLPSSQTICIRHDHDGCVWNTQDVNDDDDNNIDNWKICHTNTFPGFGYVEASKSNKRFCISPRKCEYVAIIEHARHAFIYERPINNSTIAKQKIVDLGPDSQPIMGASATKNYLILLTKNKLYQLKITQ